MFACTGLWTTFLCLVLWRFSTRVTITAKRNSSFVTKKSPLLPLYRPTAPFLTVQPANLVSAYKRWWGAASATRLSRAQGGWAAPRGRSAARAERSALPPASPTTLTVSRRNAPAANRESWAQSPAPSAGSWQVWGTFRPSLSLGVFSWKRGFRAGATAGGGATSSPR